MKAYFLVCGIAVIFIMLADFFFKKKSNLIGWLAMLVSLLSLVIVAAVRESSVGTDIKFYYYQIFYDFVMSGKSIMAELHIANVEPGFVILVYLSSIFKDFNISMGIIQFVIIIPIYILAYKLRNKYSMTMVILVFITTMYVRSFNLIRQSIAMTWTILSIYYYFNEEYKKCIGILIGAAFIHISALIVISIYFIIYLYKLNNKNRYYMLCGMYIVLFTSIILFNPILSLIGGRYERYISNSSNMVDGFSIFSLVKKIFWIMIAVFLIINSKKVQRKEVNWNSKIALNLLFIDLVLSFLTIKIPNAGRIGYYFINVAYIIIGINFSNIFKQKKMVNVILSVIFVMFWINMTAVKNSGDGTFPYTSDILKFLN